MLCGMKMTSFRLLRVFYFANCANVPKVNSNTVRHTKTELNDNDEVSIKKTKKYIVKPSFESNLVYIKSNFTILIEGINKLQTKGLSLITALKIIEDIEESFK